jgi:1,4-dihydroxy-2-naphthoate octaprenyltransferase
MTMHPVKKWAVSLRIFSLPFIVLPYALGVLFAAYAEGTSFKPGLNIIAFVPVFLIFSAANLQSDIIDFRKGIDVVANDFSGGIVRKWISIREAMSVVIFLYIASLLSGIFLLVSIGTVMIPFLLLGFLLSLFYSAGDKFAFKYNVTGEWFIFGGFGILIPLYGYAMNTGHVSLSPLLISLPSAFLIAAVKHANNWIAVLTPGNPEKGTTAYYLSGHASRTYYYSMIAIPYLIIGVIALLAVNQLNWAPGSIYITFYTLPLFILLVRKAMKQKRINPRNRIFGLDSITALLYILFTSLCCLSLIIG